MIFNQNSDELSPKIRKKLENFFCKKYTLREQVPLDTQNRVLTTLPENFCRRPLSVRLLSENDEKNKKSRKY